MRKLDPYGDLEYVIGSGDDFVCFDFDVDRKSGTVRFASTLNCETGHFIQAFENNCTVKMAEAVEQAKMLVSAALDWCGENEVRKTFIGWNQDPTYFVRVVRAAVEGKPIHEVKRRVRHWYMDV